MSPNSISHRLFIAALAPNEPVSGRRAAAARALGESDTVKTNAPKPPPSFSPSATGRVGEWSWSGWQHNTI